MIRREKKKIGSREKCHLEFYQHFTCVGGDPEFSESYLRNCKEFFFNKDVNYRKDWFMNYENELELFFFSSKGKSFPMGSEPRL